jgi:predicted TIM-barrel fold metal-dependent hydrolase
MPVIDVQVHPFDRNHPGRPWASPSHGLKSATGEEMVAAMASVGVDGAIMVSSFSAYEYDPSYALEVYNTYPDKFRVVTPVDANDPAIDDVVAKWAATKGARGIRIRMREGLPMDADHPGLNRAFAAAGKHWLPVNLLCWGILDKGLPHIQRHPDTVIVIDHLGLLQPARPPGSARRLGRSAEAARVGSIRERKGEDQRRLHDVAPTVSLRRHLGPGAENHRRVRAGSLHVGHRLDAGDRHADL